jgi:hypothetical protein
MNSRDLLTAGALALIAAALFVGCGEAQQTFNANEAPPLSADALSDAQNQDKAVEDAERAESARISGPGARSKKH